MSRDYEKKTKGELREEKERKKRKMPVTGRSVFLLERLKKERVERAKKKQEERKKKNENGQNK